MASPTFVVVVFAAATTALLVQPDEDVLLYVDI